MKACVDYFKFLMSEGDGVSGQDSISSYVLLLVIIVIMIATILFSIIKNIRELDPSNKEEKKLICGNVLKFVFALAAVFGMSFYLINNEAIDTLSKVDNVSEINNKVSSGYEVMLDFGENREVSLLSDYECKFNDFDKFDIVVNDSDKTIMLRVK